MGLQVWLPLNGNTKQQGVSGITMTGSPNSWVNGKIGQCAHFEGNTSSVIYNNTSDFNYTDDFSWAIWVKTNYTGSTAQYIFTNGRADAGGYGYGLQCSSTTNCNCRFGNSSWSIPVTGGEWTHLTFTKNGTTIKIYKNGILYNTYTFSGTLPTYSDGNGLGLGCFHYSSNIYPFYGDLNDFRIYDHALSPLEVKHLAQGLVLHYPLAMPGQENLVTGSNTNSTSTNQWFGRSSVGGNASTIEVDETGTNCVKVTRDSTTQSSWDFLSYDALLRNQLKTNTTYTVSFDAKPSVDGTITLNGFMNSNATNNMTTSVVQVQSNLLANKWNHCVYHCTTLNSFDRITISGQIVYLTRSASLKGVNTTVLFKNIKVEEGEIDTPWMPNSTDAFYTSLGFDDGIEYDVSGFGNNGTRVGTFSWSGDTPRYGVSVQFNGTQYIQLPFPCGTISEAVTVVCWGYESDWNTTYAERLIGAATGSSGWCIGDYGSENTLFAFYANGSYNSASGFKQLSNGWHHFAITFDGFNLKYYVDGVLFSSKTFSTKQSATGVYNIQIGQHYGGACNFKGKISDVRIYATALSADDVLELYHTPISLSNNGTLLTQGEYVES